MSEMRSWRSHTARIGGITQTTLTDQYRIPVETVMLDPEVAELEPGLDYPMVGTKVRNEQGTLFFTDGVPTTGLRGLAVPVKDVNGYRSHRLLSDLTWPGKREPMKRYRVEVTGIHEADARNKLSIDINSVELVEVE